jgi:hypothetical protein
LYISPEKVDYPCNSPDWKGPFPTMAFLSLFPIFSLSPPKYEGLALGLGHFTSHHSKMDFYDITSLEADDLNAVAVGNGLVVVVMYFPPQWWQ